MQIDKERTATSRPELRVISDGCFEVVEMLEGLLTRAKAGEFDSIAFGAVFKDRPGICTGWSRPGTGQWSRLSGALGYLEFRMHRSLDESDDG